MKHGSLYEKIDQYLDGEMQSGEQQAFERSAQQDPELSEMLEERRALHAYLEDGIRQEKVDTLMRRGELRDRRIKIRRYITGLAAAAALVAGAVLFWPMERPPAGEAAPVKEESTTKPQPIAALWGIVTPPDIPQSLGTEAGEGWKEDWQSAKLEFQSGRYAEAAAALSALLRNPQVPESRHSMLRLMLGYAYFDIGEWGAAETAFSGIPITNSLEREAQYFLALTALRQGDRPEAKRRLQQVAEDDQNPYQQEAKTWLASLPDD